MKWLMYVVLGIAILTGLYVVFEDPKEIKRNQAHATKMAHNGQQWGKEAVVKPVETSGSIVQQYYYKTKALLRGTFDWKERSQIRMCTFAVEALAQNRRNQENLRAVVETLSKYDLIALQGVRNERALKTVVDMLRNRGKDYGYMISPWVGLVDQDRFAFLYLRNKVRVVKEGQLFSPKIQNFEIAPRASCDKIFLSSTGIHHIVHI